jgi:hypothetical protein
MTDLPSNDEPLVLADGTKIDPTTGEAYREQRSQYVEVPSNSHAQRTQTRYRKRLADLPAPPKQMNAVGAVIFYRLVGLEDDEIAYATGMTEEQVGKLSMSDIFKEVKDEIVKSILEQDADDVRNLFMQNNKKMANRLFELAESDDEKVALNAVNSALDRGGQRPADIVEHRHSVEGGLTIEYIDRGKNDDTPTLDVEYTDVEDDQ